MEISVVISTWNNAHRLRSTLRALTCCRAPTGSSWQVVLVNNNCTDGTDGVASEFGSRLPLVYVHEPRPGLSYGRNTGVAAASGKLAVFTDDDVEPDPDWLCIIADAYRRFPDKCFFGGPIISAFEGHVPDKGLLKWAPPSIKGLDWGAQERFLHQHEYFVAANWACPRQALIECGGFPTDRGLNPASGRVQVGEESAAMERLQAAGLSARYLPDAKIKHFVPASKCTIRHIGLRRGASVRQQVIDTSLAFGRPASHFATRVRLVASVCKQYTRWLCRTVVRADANDAYVAWRMSLGALTGALQVSNSTGAETR